MSAPFLAVNHNTAIAQRQFAVSLSRSNLIRKHTAHLHLTIIRQNTLAEIHHTPTFGDNTSSPLSIFTYRPPASLRPMQFVEMLLWISSRKIKQIRI